MTEPIDQATKERIEKEAEAFSHRSMSDAEYVSILSPKGCYIAGATVWAEMLKQQEKEVSLRESQQDVMAADMVKLMDQIEYQKKAAKKDYDRIKKLEFRLKQERNKVIDEFYNLMDKELQTEPINRARYMNRLFEFKESLKDKSHE